MARGKRALLALLTGDFATGWARLRMAMEGSRDFPHNRRYGRTCRSGRDPISLERRFFCTRSRAWVIRSSLLRYAPLVAQRGAKVVLQCQSEVVSLLAKVQGVSEIVSDEQTPPRFDVQCPLMSLPLAFGTTLATIPATVPYLTADTAIAERWRPRLASAGKRKIGLVWAGRPTHRKDPGPINSSGGLCTTCHHERCSVFRITEGTGRSGSTHAAGGNAIGLTRT